MIKYEKYINVNFNPNVENGSSTGFAPIHVNRIVVFRYIQNIICLIGYIDILLNFLFIEIGLIIKIEIDITSAITPPSLLGIDRRIAYANKKYHSGLIWIGVFIGFAGEKLSGSDSINGSEKFKVSRIVSIVENPIKSLIEKYGWNGILSMFLLIPIGLFEPVSCKNIKWIITTIEINNGRIKCREKNREIVAFLTANPPQIHFTKLSPM